MKPGDFPEFSRNPCARYDVRELLIEAKGTAKCYNLAKDLVGDGEVMYLYHPYLKDDQVYSRVHNPEELKLLFSLHGKKTGDFKLVVLRKKVISEIVLAPTST